jgi:hypothetical protein
MILFEVIHDIIRSINVTGTPRAWNAPLMKSHSSVSNAFVITVFMENDFSLYSL